MKNDVYSIYTYAARKSMSVAVVRGISYGSQI